MNTLENSTPIHEHNLNAIGFDAIWTGTYFTYYLPSPRKPDAIILAVRFEYQPQYKRDYMVYLHMNASPQIEVPLPTIVTTEQLKQLHTLLCNQKN